MKVRSMKMSKRRHIKFWRYYKEWIETYKDGQVQDVTYAKYLMIQKQIKILFQIYILMK